MQLRTFLWVSALIQVANSIPPLEWWWGSNSTYLYYHGRWDTTQGTWWAGTGFKFVARDLRNITLSLRANGTNPNTAIGFSIGGRPWVTLNVSAGRAVLPVPQDLPKGKDIVARVNVQGWQNNRISFEGVTVNADLSPGKYQPSKLVFQFIGDSLSAGQFLPAGVNQAWPFIVGEYFKAEHRINAQPGATLTDMESYGNAHGLSYQFFQTEDTGYYYTTDHNFTTPWDFTHDQPVPSHVVVHVGANDASHGVPKENFTTTYLNFLANLRGYYPYQPFFILSPWGWPEKNGSVSYYYQGVYDAIVYQQNRRGDLNTYFVNTTGWVTLDDVFPDNVHPHVAGHQKIAKNFIDWLAVWGLV